MAILALTPDAPEALTVDGGDPAEKLHVTLAWFGDEDGHVPEEVQADAENVALAEAAQIPGQIQATVSEVGELGDDGAIVMFLESSDVHNYRDRIVAGLADVGIEIDDKFPDYLPHLTAGYGETDEEKQALMDAATPMIGEEIVFTATSFMDDDIRSDAPFGIDTGIDPDIVVEDVLVAAGPKAPPGGFLEALVLETLVGQTKIDWLMIYGEGVTNTDDLIAQMPPVIVKNQRIDKAIVDEVIGLFENDGWTVETGKDPTFVAGVADGEAQILQRAEQTDGGEPGEGDKGEQEYLEDLADPTKMSTKGLTMAFDPGQPRDENGRWRLANIDTVLSENGNGVIDTTTIEAGLSEPVYTEAAAAIEAGDPQTALDGIRAALEIENEGLNEEGLGLSEEELDAATAQIGNQVIAEFDLPDPGDGDAGDSVDPADWSNEELVKAAYSRDLDQTVKTAMLEERDRRFAEARSPEGFTPPAVAVGDTVKVPPGHLGSGQKIKLTEVTEQPDGRMLYRGLDNQGREAVWGLPAADRELNRVVDLEVVDEFSTRRLSVDTPRFSVGAPTMKTATFAFDPGQPRDEDGKWRTVSGAPAPVVDDSGIRQGVSGPAMEIAKEMLANGDVQGGLDSLREDLAAENDGEVNLSDEELDAATAQIGNELLAEAENDGGDTSETATSDWESPLAERIYGAKEEAAEALGTNSRDMDLDSQGRVLVGDPTKTGLRSPVEINAGEAQLEGIWDANGVLEQGSVTIKGTNPQVSGSQVTRSSDPELEGKIRGQVEEWGRIMGLETADLIYTSGGQMNLRKPRAMKSKRRATFNFDPNQPRDEAGMWRKALVDGGATPALVDEAMTTDDPSATLIEAGVSEGLVNDANEQLDAYVQEKEAGGGEAVDPDMVPETPEDAGYSPGTVVFTEEGTALAVTPNGEDMIDPSWMGGTDGRMRDEMESILSDVDPDDLFSDTFEETFDVGPDMAQKLRDVAQIAEGLDMAPVDYIADAIKIENLGWAVKEQLDATLGGRPLEESNPNALKMIADTLRDSANQEFADVAVAIQEYLDNDFGGGGRYATKRTAALSMIRRARRYGRTFAFDPGQPRDENGRWRVTGASPISAQMDADGAVADATEDWQLQNLTNDMENEFLSIYAEQGEQAAADYMLEQVTTTDRANPSNDAEMPDALREQVAADASNMILANEERKGALAEPGLTEGVAMDEVIPAGSSAVMPDKEYFAKYPLDHSDTAKAIQGMIMDDEPAPPAVDLSEIEEGASVVRAIGRESDQAVGNDSYVVTDANGTVTRVSAGDLVEFMETGFLPGRDDDEFASRRRIRMAVARRRLGVQTRNQKLSAARRRLGVSTRKERHQMAIARLKGQFAFDPGQPRDENGRWRTVDLASGAISEDAMLDLEGLGFEVEAAFEDAFAGGDQQGAMDGLRDAVKNSVPEGTYTDEELDQATREIAKVIVDNASLGDDLGDMDPGMDDVDMSNPNPPGVGTEMADGDMLGSVGDQPVLADGSPATVPVQLGDVTVPVLASHPMDVQSGDDGDFQWQLYQDSYASAGQELAEHINMTQALGPETTVTVATTGGGDGVDSSYEITATNGDGATATVEITPGPDGMISNYTDGDQALVDTITAWALTGGSTPAPVQEEEQGTLFTNRKARSMSTTNRRTRPNQRKRGAFKAQPVKLEAAGTTAPWEGLLVVEGIPSGDKRTIDKGALTWRNLPLPLMMMTKNPVGGEGHDGAELAGRIEWIERRDNDQVWAGGSLDLACEAGADAFRRMTPDEQGRTWLRGVSVDLDDFEMALDAGGDPEFMTDEELQNVGIRVTRGRVMGATLTPFPAFQEAELVLVSEALAASLGGGCDCELEETLVASAGIAQPNVQARVFTPWDFDTEAAALVASGAPMKPPMEWFELPPNLTINDLGPVRVGLDGRISGFAADTKSCHIGFGKCVTAPKSKSNYAMFLNKQTETAEGTLIATGPLVMDTVHPDLKKLASDAQAFYAHTGCAVADVRAYDTQFGVYIAGALRPTATPEQIRALRGSDISPDWRVVNGALDCVAMLAVNTSGFITPALVASAGDIGTTVRPGKVTAHIDMDTGEITALVAAGMVEHSPVSALRAEVTDLKTKLMAMAEAVDPILAERRQERHLSAKARLGANTRMERLAVARARLNN